LRDNCDNPILADIVKGRFFPYIQSADGGAASKYFSALLRRLCQIAGAEENGFVEGQIRF